MGLYEKLFKRPRPAAEAVSFFKALNAYTPVFTSRVGSIYEMELTRSAIHAFATHASKLKPEQSGTAKPHVKALLDSQPNPFMDTSKFLYRTATIVGVDTTAFIIPILDETGRVLEGFFPLLPSRTEIVEFEGEPWMSYTFPNGQTAAIEFSRVGIVNSHQYKDDFFGDGHRALNPTLDLLDVQRQGMSEGIKNAATIRFFGRLAGTLRPEDIRAERDRFSKDNLSAENTSGIMLADSKYADLQQVDSKPFVIDAEQMKLIKDNVFGYFGVSQKILENDYDENAWNAFYEGKIEPFALQLSLVLTNMVFNERERAAGNAIMFSSNRLQYASNDTKVKVTESLSDRGLLSNWAACDIWNLPRPKNPDGTDAPERWIIRGEYIDTEKLPEHTVGDDKNGVTVQVNSPAGEGVVEDLQATALNGAQIAALVQVIQSLKEESLTLGQAANIVAVALAISVEEAKKIVEGTM